MSATSQGAEQAHGFSSPYEAALLELMRSADCLHHSFQQRLKPSGLTPTQYNVLRILRAAGAAGLTCSAIGRMMITPVPDITRLLGRLKTQKLLRQRRDTHDRRVVWTTITARGVEALAPLDGIVERTPRELLGRLSAEEIQQLTGLLRKAQCCGGCDEQESERPGPPDAIGRPPLPRSSGSILRRPHRG